MVSNENDSVLIMSKGSSSWTSSLSAFPNLDSAAAEGSVLELSAVARRMKPDPCAAGNCEMDATIAMACLNNIIYISILVTMVSVCNDEEAIILEAVNCAPICVVCCELLNQRCN